MRFRMLLAACAAGVLLAQMQIPMPRIPIPGRKSTPKSPGEKKQAANEILSETKGIVRSINSEAIALEANDTRIVRFKCSKITRYFRKGEEIPVSTFKPGDEVLIEYRQDDEGFFYAVNVSLEKQAEKPVEPPAAAQEPAPPSNAPVGKPQAAEEPGPPPSILRPPAADPDAEAPPALRRGKPAPRAAKPAPVPEQPVSLARTSAPTASRPAPAPRPEPEIVEAPRALTKDEAFIENARETALTFSETLPNYLCHQMTTRYQSEGRPPSWQPIDVVEAEVVYEGGPERYVNIKINGKLQKKPMEELAGSWSKGEFSSTLLDLFSPATVAQFRFRRESSASGLPALMYDFRVEQRNSHWETRIGGQSVFPAYKGSLWLDKKSMRALRIEMQAINVPSEFPLDTIEWVVDYAFVRIGTAEFLLPVHGENLSCWRSSSRCARNALDFRNYRKFTSESQIMTTDSNINFDGDEKPAAKPAPKKK